MVFIFINFMNKSSSVQQIKSELSIKLQLELATTYSFVLQFDYMQNLFLLFDIY